MMLAPYEGLFGRAEVEKYMSCLRRRLVQSSIARWITGVGRPWVICVVTKAQRPYYAGKYREMLRELPIYQESCSSFVSLTTVSSRADEDVRMFLSVLDRTLSTASTFLSHCTRGSTHITPTSAFCDDCCVWALPGVIPRT